MRFILLLILVIAISGSGLTQSAGKTKKTRRDSVAKAQLITLQEGMLLVRLRSNLKKLKALENKGDSIGVRNEKRAIRLKQLEIVNAFKLNYDFSEVYFFQSHHSKEVKEGDFKGIILNDSLEVVDVTPDKFFVLDPYRVEFGSMNTSQSGLSVMNSKFKQLEKPFPYYVRKRDGFFFLRRGHFEMVSVFQKNLDWAKQKYGL